MVNRSTDEIWKSEEVHEEIKIPVEVTGEITSDAKVMLQALKEVKLESWEIMEDHSGSNSLESQPTE